MQMGSLREKSAMRLQLSDGAVLNETLEDAFRHRYPGFRSANDDQARSAAA
jgi:hypothetical protein